MRAKPEDYPVGSAIRAQLEQAESEGLTKRLDRAVSRQQRKHEEDDLQRACFNTAKEWPLRTLLDLEVWPREHPAGDAIREFPLLGDWLFAVPNGGARTPVEAKILKGLGVMAGVHDIFLMLPVCQRLPQGPHYCAGLWMELKAGDGKQSDKQIAFGKKALAVGFRGEEIRSARQFQQAVIDYLKGARPWN